MKILIVDDDVELTKAVVSTLSSVGHDVQFTNEPKEGLKLIKEQSQDVVFLDLTASAVGDEELDGLVELGIHSFLKKPVDIDAILDKIDEIGS
jgi:CheY-like chemotaxis protein